MAGRRLEETARSCAGPEFSLEREDRKHILRKVRICSRRAASGVPTNVLPSISDSLNWCFCAWSPSVYVICGEAKLKLLPLGHRHGNFFDFKIDGLVCRVRLDSSPCLDAVGRRFRLRNVDSSFLMCGLAVGLELVIHMVRNLIEERYSSWRIWQNQLALSNKEAFRGRSYQRLV